MKTVMPFILVGAGGCAGSMLRYLMTVLFRNFHPAPFGTLVSNIAGCFLIGVIAGLSADVPLLSAEARLLLATGVCGGFTTLSSFIYELAEFMKDGEYLAGSLYATGTLFGAALAFFVGTLCFRLLLRG